MDNLEKQFLEETALLQTAQEIVKEVAADVKVPETKAGEVAPKRERRGEYDVVVVGGGPAGYVAAIKAAH